MSSNLQAQSKPLIYLPFEKGSEWYCVQAPGGEFSHMGKLKYAFDFTKGSNVNSQDNPTFGEWVYSPVKGEIIKVVNYVQDFKYNDKNHKKKNNYGYGNELIIKAMKPNAVDKFYYVRMLHFKQNSIVLNVGDQVEIGDPVGQIGQSGFSTGPHLHIHLSVKHTARHSVPFGFVEGPVEVDKWYSSAITPGSNLIDNDKSTTAGAEFNYATAYGSSAYWQYSNKAFKDTGNGYRITKTPAKKFKWKFRLKEWGLYAIWVRYPAHPNGDPYTLYRANSTQIYKNQSSTSSDGWHMLDIFQALPGKMYQVSVESSTPGKHVMADAIDVIRLW